MTLLFLCTSIKYNCISLFQLHRNLTKNKIFWIYRNPIKENALEKWVQSIQKLQEFVFDSNKIIKRKMFVLCDLHFNPDDIIKQELEWMLKPDTVPIISYVLMSLNYVLFLYVFIHITTHNWLACLSTIEYRNLDKPPNAITTRNITIDTNNQRQLLTQETGNFDQRINSPDYQHNSGSEYSICKFI